MNVSEGHRTMEKTICELFAGVGGFRLGFEKNSADWKTVWFSQWEPGKKNQWAHDCYVQHFGESADVNGEYHTGEDIGTIDKETIPNHTLLVGGFPCQDYSVANSLSQAKGIEGKKGVLWWQIREILEAKKAPFGLFENVDRLLKSPASQRGRDFAIILACLAALNYSAEWRVINAADYGAGQRRRRVFIFAYKNETNYGQAQAALCPKSIVYEKGFFASVFPVKHPIEKIDEQLFMFSDEEVPQGVVDYTNIPGVSDSFEMKFHNAGVMRNGKIFTYETSPITEQPITLRELAESDVAEKYYLGEDLAKWEYLKGSKKITRKSKSGYEYQFSEGAIAFPDSLDLPARTMLTSESSLNRSTHVIADPQTNRLRILTPLEAERIQGFDDEWTNTGMPEKFRYFCMGNALVVPLITKMAGPLGEIIENE